MTEELEILWRLRGLDERSVAVTGGLARHPGEREALEKRLQFERVRLEGHEKSLHDHKLKHREIEKDVESLQAEERKFAGQLPLLKKNEEYTAMMKEIAGRKAKRSDRETELLVLMEEEQQLNSERPAIEKGLKAIEAETKERLAALEAEERREREELAALDQERRSLTEKLSASTASRYERTRASREGRAVVPIIKGGACGGCFRGQSPQVLQEARRGDRVLTCDGCGRIVILPPDS